MARAHHMDPIDVGLNPNTSRKRKAVYREEEVNFFLDQKIVFIPALFTTYPLATLLWASYYG